MKVVEVEKKHYVLAFADVRAPGSGYAFPCDKDGHILWDSVSSPETTRKSLAYCKTHPDRWTSSSRDGKVVAVVERKRYGVCPYCGHEVYVDEGGYMCAVECTCGHWYNTFGQELLPPDEWDEE